MRKMPMLLGVLFVVTLIAMLGISPAQAIVEEHSWLPPYVEKTSSQVIYKDGSAVNLKVVVRNHQYASGLNVSKVIINFEWGENQTLDLSANITQVGWLETETFTVSFTANLTEAVSSEYARTYTVYVEHVNATTGPTEKVGAWSDSWTHRFVVYSTDQADLYDLKKEYGEYATAYPTWMFSNINGSQLAGQAIIEAKLGEMYDDREDYASAKTKYQTALDLYSQALAAELEWRTKTQEANLNEDNAAMIEANASKTTADTAKTTANAMLTQSYGWILFGLGFILIGIGALIYAYKKPQAVA